MTVDPNDIISPASTFGSRADGHVYINKEELTQFGSVPSSATSRPVDGNKAGELIGLSIGPDGIVRGAYDNDSIRELFQIPLARFANRAALSRAGNNLFTETANSGVASIVDAQTGGNSLMGGVLEMANVDLSFEFTEMITTQRGFQANSRIITVSDDMLAELVNLKR
jgi:flagellar hook protein FlgE